MPVSVVAPTVLGMDATTDTDELTDAERAMLDLEQGWWKYAGAKETEVRRLFDVSSTTYYQRLNALIDQRAAMAYAPLVVRRLRRLRAARRQQRTAILATFND